MNKNLFILALAAAFTVSMSVQQAAADKRNRDRNAAIAGAVVLGLIGAAAAHSQDRRQYREYRPRRGIRPDENAVGTCMLYTKRLVREAGGYRARLNSVRRITNRSNGRTVVAFSATGFYDFGRKRSQVRCVVKNYRVINYSYN